MIVLVSLIVLLRGFPCFHDFSHAASLHPYSFIFALVLLCLSTHSSFTISGRVRVRGYSNWFSVGGESPLGYVHSIDKFGKCIVQARAIENALA